MADVSLDDLIKKDREKGKLDRLKNVHLIPLRNSKPKNLSKEADPSIIKTEVTEDLEILLLESTDQLKSILIILAMIAGKKREGLIQGINALNAPDLSMRKRKKDKRSSAH